MNMPVPAYFVSLYLSGCTCLAFRQNRYSRKNLRQKNYVTVSEEGFIHLTEEGRLLAETVYERHSLISGWLVSLGVDPEVAAEDACRMEHDISAESFAAIKKCISQLMEN